MISESDIQTEIELEFDNGGFHEYRALVIPRKGDFMDISIPKVEIEGYYEVESVTHRVFQPKGKTDIRSYVKVKLNEIK